MRGNFLRNASTDACRQETDRIRRDLKLLFMNDLSKKIIFWTSSRAFAINTATQQIIAKSLRTSFAGTNIIGIYVSADVSHHEAIGSGLVSIQPLRSLVCSFANCIESRNLKFSWKLLFFSTSTSRLQVNKMIFRKQHPALKNLVAILTFLFCFIH